MRTIWKFRLDHASPATSHGVDMPVGAEVVRFKLDGLCPTIWALVDDKAEREVVSFTVYGTGHEVPPHARYVGTWEQGPLVWHLFDVTRR